MVVSPKKYFNTWSTKSPAVMEFLPAAFAICPGAFSEKEASYSPLPFGEGMRLMDHHKDGAYVKLVAGHAGTSFSIEYAKADDYTLLCRVKTCKPGEWGLRFWLTFAFGFLGSEGKMQEYVGCYRSYKIAVAFRDAPIRTAHTNTPDAEGEKMAREGYYAPELEEEDARWTVAKFNLELTPEILFSVAIANDEEQARKKAQAALKSDIEALREDSFEEELTALGDFSSAADAIRDVMAWNTIFDQKHQRAMTSLTRFWIDRKFGGWFVWLDDVFYHALISLVSGDQEMARANLLAALSSACPAGNLACLMSEYTEWVDRSQPPIFAYILYKYYLFTGETEMLERGYCQLVTSLKWWRSHRMTNDGLFCYGSSDVGEGHWKHTKLAAKDESSMDNSPLYDDASYDPATGRLDMHDIALSSLLAVEAEHLSYMAKELGRGEEEAKLAAFAREIREKIDAVLYDEERHCYANRKLDGTFAPLSPTSFYPMLAGVPKGERLEALLAHLHNEEEFDTYAPLPAIAANHPAAQEGSYWRGRMWPPLNFLTHAGLRRMGEDEAAYRLAKRSMEIFDAGWQSGNHCYENYNTFTGEGRHVDADPYYGWGALLPLMWILEHIDLDAQNGLNLAASSENEFGVENFRIRGKKYKYQVNAHAARLYQDGHQILYVRGMTGRVRNIVLEEHYMAFTFDAQPFKGADVFLPPLAAKCIWINQEEQDLPEHRFKMPAGQEVRLEIWF